MKRILVLLVLLMAVYSAFAQNDSDAVACTKKFFRGIEGGVVFNTGYAFVNFPAVGYAGGGVPLGVGGRGLAILGDHLRVGGEGYMNTIGLDKKGSESVMSFGGVMADFYWDFGPVLAYVGSNIGGGIFKTMLSSEKPESSWDEVSVCYNKQFVWSAHPYTGIQIKIARKLSIIVQVSYTLPLNGDICREFNCLNTSIGLEFGG